MEPRKDHIAGKKNRQIEVQCMYHWNTVQSLNEPFE